jgi:aminoglycoside phosphotransferase (APT) family kinase protein
LLADGGAITGVIDINPPVLAGDRAFDLATPLFYLYDHDDIRARLLKLAGPMAARALSRPYGAAATRLIAAPAFRSRCHAPPQRLAKLIAADLGHWPER